MHAERSRKVVAIDGPAASGKSSTAAWVARELGYRHLDSGALYRAVTAAYLRSGATLELDWSEPAVLRAAARCALLPNHVSFVPAIDGLIAETEVRSTAVTENVSRVAKMPLVREWVNDALRAIAAEFDVVVDGRDIGTAVFPDAFLKIHLVADPWERARRRLVQQGGVPSDAEIAAETERLLLRDERDAAQSVPAVGGVLIDTTYITQPEQVARIVALARSAGR